MNATRALYKSGSIIFDLSTLLSYQKKPVSSQKTPVYIFCVVTLAI
jgi:hypothetical protein